MSNLLMTVAMNGEWFELAGEPRVSIATRLPLRRLLLALAELREKARTNDEATLTATAAFEAGWPGERATPKAAAMRVYTAIHSLRRLGLEDILMRRSRGYILKADEVKIARESTFPPALEQTIELCRTA